MTFVGRGEGVEASEAYINAELDARSQAVAAGFDDDECFVLDFYVAPINWLIPPPPGSPLWTSQVTLECEDRPVIED